MNDGRFAVPAVIGSVASPNRETESMRDGSDAIDACNTNTESIIRKPCTVGLRPAILLFQSPRGMEVTIPASLDSDFMQSEIQEPEMATFAAGWTTLESTATEACIATLWW